MIRAMFFDLDGTLLTSRKRITDTTASVLVQCREKGIKILTATARPPLLDKMLSSGNAILSLIDGGVYCNGGCIILDREKRYRTIHRELVQRILDAVAAYEGPNIALQMEDERHAFRYPLEADKFSGWGIAPQEALPLSACNRWKTVKLMVFYDSLIDTIKTVDESLTASLQELCRDRAQFYLTDNGRCVQIMGQSVNKLAGIEDIRERLGLDQDEIAVFGDDDNDIEMLSHYKHSFAMGNANRHVQEIAGFVTLDNDSDGIAHAITTILKLV